MLRVQVLSSVQGIICGVSGNPPDNSFSSSVFMKHVEMTASSSGFESIEKVLKKQVREKDFRIFSHLFFFFIVIH